MVSENHRRVSGCHRHFNEQRKPFLKWHFGFQKLCAMGAAFFNNEAKTLPNVNFSATFGPYKGKRILCVDLSPLVRPGSIIMILN